VRAVRLRDRAGFSIVEALIATGMLAGAVLSLAQVFAAATASNAAAARATQASVLAARKLEELRTLSWVFDEAGAVRSELTTDTTRTPESSAGGTGLTPSPASALDEDTAGYVDYIDRFGAKLVPGDHPPPGALFTRRWSIRPLPADPGHTLVIQVRVIATVEAGRAARRAGRLPGEARLVLVRSRRAM
jgi:type II secretory pathway pseudopilin PulG